MIIPRRVKRVFRLEARRANDVGRENRENIELRRARKRNVATTRAAALRCVGNARARVCVCTRRAVYGFAVVT